MKPLADVALQHDIEQFLYEEARLLDEGDFHAWLDLFTEDAVYWMPVRETRASHKAGILAKGELAIFEDDKAYLTARVARIDTGLAHAESPPSRTRHFVSNVQVIGRDDHGLLVRSAIAVFQSRLEGAESWFVGHREDAIAMDGDTWRIRRRKIVLDHAVLPRSISIFF
jgi:3-phenylpropionate/cinnamic acid dioxygenase small subunit